MHLSQAIEDSIAFGHNRNCSRDPEEVVYRSGIALKSIIDKQCQLIHIFDFCCDSDRGGCQSVRLLATRGKPGPSLAVGK